MEEYNYESAERAASLLINAFESLYTDSFEVTKGNKNGKKYFRFANQRRKVVFYVQVHGEMELNFVTCLNTHMHNPTQIDANYIGVKFWNYFYGKVAGNQESFPKKIITVKNDQGVATIGFVFNYNSNLISNELRNRLMTI